MRARADDASTLRRDLLAYTEIPVDKWAGFLPDAMAAKAGARGWNNLITGFALCPRTKLQVYIKDPVA